MANENITVYLSTPLLKLREEDEEIQHIMSIKAKLTDSDDSGLTLLVREIGNEKEWTKPINLKKIFIPFHKIDYYIFD